MEILVRKLKYCFTLLALTILFQSAMAQITVTGTVSDAISGETLVGATVVIQGTTTGSVTDIDGNYSITVPDPNATLVVSYVGYLNEEIPVNGRTSVNVALSHSIETLSEMVVIGYGVVRRSDLTGSVAVVSSEDLNRIPAANFTQALQGRASGVMVTQGGSPGSQAQIRVRGVGSINRSSNPIYVIDGIVTGSLNSVSPTDIETIQVLKDASAAAIYGADGANGVIIITTKRGESGKPRVSYSNYLKNSWVPRQFELMNADEYADFYSQIQLNRGNLVTTAYTDAFRQQYYGDGWREGTDWQAQGVQSAMGHNHNVRISGGGDGSNYSISANFYTEDGILKTSSAERFNLRANSDFELGRYVKIGESFTVTRGIQRVPRTAVNPWSGSLIASPLMRVHHEDNKGGYEGPQRSALFINEAGDSLYYNNTGGNDKHNPLVSMMLGDDRRYSTNILTSIYLEVKPISWLTFRTTPSVDANFSRRKNWMPAYESGVRSYPEATLNEEFGEWYNLSLENQVTFNNRFGLHNITATAVHHVRKNEGNTINATVIGYPYEILRTITGGYDDRRSVGGNYHPFSSESYLGRVIYDYDSKYLLTASLRRDGNSRFGSVNRWGNFPSASVAWKINEDFLQGIEEISMLKVRVGWGRTGNSDIGAFQYQSLIDPFTNFSPVFGADQQIAPALNVIHSFGNPGILWESAEMLNFGIDLNLLYDKIQLSAEYYIKDQDNLLVKQPVSAMFGRVAGLGDPWVNLGEIQNRGFEFTALYRKMEGAFNYNLSTNITTVTNTVKYVPGTIATPHNITQIGNSIGSFYGYIAERIITPDDFDENGNYLYALPSEGTPQPGDLMFKDLNNDGIINSDDRTIIGKAIPDLIYSLNVEAMYRGFDLSVFLHGMHNYQVYNHMRADIEGFSSQDIDHNKSRAFYLNHYREDRPSTEFTRLDPDNTNLNNRTSTWYLEDASFFRVKDIQIGYTLPHNTARSLGMESARIFVSASNLVTVTRYTGRDPESPTVGSGNDRIISPNSDFGSYPVPKSISAGIHVNL